MTAEESESDPETELYGVASRKEAIHPELLFAQIIRNGRSITEGEEAVR